MGLLCVRDEFFILKYIFFFNCAKLAAEFLAYHVFHNNNSNNNNNNSNNSNNSNNIILKW